ncbi:hypothetical protein EON65_07825 [archaeon]|nr:MAG: hypothetical protein EON65_07825 [archaeon]
MNQRISSVEYKAFFADLLGERYEYFNATFSDISSEMSALYDLTVRKVAGKVNETTLYQRLCDHNCRWKVYSTTCTQPDTVLTKSVCVLFLVDDITEDIMRHFHKVAYKQALGDKLFVLYDGVNLVNPANVLYGMRFHHISRINDLFEQLQATIVTPIEQRISLAKVNWAADVVEKVLQGVDWTVDEEHRLHKTIRNTVHGSTESSTQSDLWHKLPRFIIWLLFICATCCWQSPSSYMTHTDTSSDVSRQHLLHPFNSSIPVTGMQYQATDSGAANQTKGNTILAALEPLTSNVSTLFPNTSAHPAITITKNTKKPQQRLLYEDTMLFIQSIFRPSYRLSMLFNTHPFAFSAFSTYNTASPTVLDETTTQQTLHTVFRNASIDRIECEASTAPVTSAMHPSNNQQGDVEIAGYAQGLLPAPNIVLSISSPPASWHLIGLRPLHHRATTMASMTQGVNVLITRMLRRAVHTIDLAFMKLVQLIQFVGDTLLL